MEWLQKVLPPGSVAGGLATLSLAVTLGLLLGAVRVRGARLGVAAVFFSSLVLSSMGLQVEEHVVHFLREFALIIFVYTIGLQVGPGFLASLRAEGLRLNLCAFAVLVLGAILSAALVLAVHLPREAGAGLFTAGFATSPGLAAAQGALHDRLRSLPDQGNAAAQTVGLVYAIGYPFGLIGPILLVLIFRKMFRIDLARERAQLKEVDEIRRPPIGFTDVEVTRPEVAGTALRDHELIRSSGIVLSRLLREQKVTVPSGDTVIRVGDIYRVVGNKPRRAAAARLLGRVSPTSLDQVSGDIQRIRLIVTHRHVLRKSLRELDLIRRFGVTITRVNRAGVELSPRADLTLKFGDNVAAVGPSEGLKKVEAELGNSVDVLNRPQLVPVFLGIVLGVIVGSIPIALPGMHDSIRIGLAGGPMIVAIILSRLGSLGSVVWYMPVSARNLFRDFGMAVFLSCIGLEAGKGFVSMLTGPHGLSLVLWAAVITLAPMLLVGAFMRVVLKMNFVTLSGFVAGAMTSSPTLLFANELTESSAPALGYAAVYPLSMLTPIICAQILATALL
ncbi:MAG TPA: putative transporter [Tepidisphaeraceae bacterium]|jgi:putative transport protein|nr:putative transporter [Tepidisphaeraceae bacterium]